MQETIKISAIQAYLELARSYVKATAHSKTSNVAVPDQVNQDSRATTTFAFAALSTVFSYATIEAFVNYEIFNIWSHSRYAHDAIEEVKKLDPSRQYVALYDTFYQKYGIKSQFDELKKTDLRDLTERIKQICKAHKIPSIASEKKELWAKLLELENARHRIIHPVPKDVEFNELAQRLFSEKPYTEYPQVAVDVISYFYDIFKTAKPEFLQANKLFKISGIEILY
ncbi:MAG: hypothetical protein HZB59_00730 [Ignavibacteriales bacterium]|nr:hypothetical protein [Ignavibacteriales bacterium]